MPLFIQIDNNIVTGTLIAGRAPDKLPGGRRFVEMDDDALPPSPLSTAVIAGDRGDPIVRFVPGSVRFDPPAPQPPAVDPILTKLQELQSKQEDILTEIKKSTGALEARPVP